MTSTTISMGAAFRDRYPVPGTRIKQYVVDERRELAWEQETCPRVPVPVHDDNCGGECRNIGAVPWTQLEHDSCHACGDLHESTSDRPDVAAWLAERAKRPPICADHSLLSDAVEPDRMRAAHPMLAGFR